MAGGVAPGSPVSAANTNAAFIDANGDDTGVGRYDLQNTVPASGPNVTNIQAEMNGQNTYAGRSSNTGKDSLPVWTDTDAGTPTDSLTARAEALTAKFNPTPSPGHQHTGAPGEGPNISAPNLINVPLRGYVQQGIDLIGVTGSSSDVSTELSGKIPSTGTTVEGVVVTNPLNKGIIRQASGTNENDVYKDGSGNVIYSKLTESLGVWTLSYFVDLAGVETAYSFGSASDVRWYYQELFNPMVNPPVYSEFANIPSDNVTADVVDATTTTKGKTLLSSSAAQPIAATGTIGTTNSTVANADHTHEGVHSVSKSGDPQIKGDATFSAGANISLTQVGSDISIAAAATVYRAGSQALVLNDLTKAVTFSSPMPSASYRLSVMIVNTTDAMPQYQAITIVVKSTTGFTAAWSGAIDSANYSLDYSAIADN